VTEPEPVTAVETATTNIATAELEALRARAESAETAHAAAIEAHTAAVVTLRDTVRAANPTIPSSLIDGADAPSIAASLTSAQAVVAEAIALATKPGLGFRTPSGAQGSQTTAPMSPGEKMAAGLAARRG